MCVAVHHGHAGGMSDERARNDDAEREWLDTADDEDAPEQVEELPLEASEPDVVDQHRPVPLDLDDHDHD